jgi:hypothetical protein
MNRACRAIFSSPGRIVFGIFSLVFHYRSSLTSLVILPLSENDTVRKPHEAVFTHSGSNFPVDPDFCKSGLSHHPERPQNGRQAFFAFRIELRGRLSFGDRFRMKK